MKRPAALAALLIMAALTIVLVQRHFRLKADGLEVVMVEPPRRLTPPEAVPAPPEKPIYKQTDSSADGIGKIYMGREISQVMGHTGIDWLEREDRDYEENPAAAIEALALSPDSVIVDVGAGSGYYTFRLAPLVPQGRVIAVDIQQEMLEFIDKRSANESVGNVESHLGAIDNIGLPDESIDAALFVDSYHEFSHPYEMMKSVAEALRPGGRVYLLEYRGEDRSIPIKPLHKMTEAQAILEMERVGLKHRETLAHLPWQHFMIFEKE